MEEDCDEVEVEVEVEAVELLPPQADSPSDARAAEERRKKVLLFMIIHLTARKNIRHNFIIDNIRLKINR